MNQQEEKLRLEILTDAKRKAERAVKRAQREADKMLQAVRSRHEEVRGQRMQAAEREAAEKHRAVTASIEHAIRKRWLTAREDVLNALFEDVLPELNAYDGIDAERSLRGLFREALAAVGPADSVLRLTPPGRRVLTDAVLEEERAELLGDGTARGTVDVLEEEDVGGGLVLETRDGRRLFDNTYATRLDRLKGDLRSQVCAGFRNDEEDSQDG